MGKAMQNAFRFGYSLAVAILFVLAAILGIRTFYDEPEGPQHPEEPFGPFGFAPPAECDLEGRCFDPVTGEALTEEEAQETREEQLKFEQELREFDEERRAFISDERAPYHRNVFIVGQVLGIAAIAVGLYLFRRVEGIPLGLLLGGLGVVIFGWAQAGEDFGEIGMAPLFVTVTIGLAIVLAAGYQFLRLAAPGTKVG
jgi:hypothetical protein